MMLRDLLADNRRYSGEFGARLSNHLSMAALALGWMGAEDDRIADFAGHYRGRWSLQPLAPSTRRLTFEEWRQALGDLGCEAQAVAYFADSLATSGRAATLHAHLPLLMRGIGASAFHALIRTAYALEADDDAELACALGYWTMSWLDLGLTEPAGETMRPLEVFETFGAAFRPTAELPPGLIFHRMAAVVAHPSFEAFAGRYSPTPSALADLAAAVVVLFAATNDFTALHAMTSTHALRIVLPWTDDRQNALAHHWRALLAAYGSMGAPAPPSEDEIARLRGAAMPGWAALRAAALASNDDHMIKSIYTAWREDEVYHDPLYALAAGRYAGLISRPPA
jgi:hypothetical protein